MNISNEFLEVLTNTSYNLINLYFLITNYKSQVAKSTVECLFGEFRMIWNQWYAVLNSCQLKKKNQLIGVTRLGEKLVFWRDSKNEVHCIFDICAHRGASLGIGCVVRDHVQCPFHGLEYDGNGKCTVIPSRGETAPVPPNFKVHYYPVRELHGFIWMWWGDIKEDGKYPELPWFDDIDDKFPYKAIIDPWRCNYSRCIENQLDVTHLWLVHYNTIGRGKNKVSDGPVAEYNKDTKTLEIWVFDRKENGIPSKLPNEMQKQNPPAMLHFKYPNIWQNRILDKMRIFVSFVPVDENNTLLYLRYYQKVVKIPGLKWLMCKIGIWGSKYIAHQDRTVVETELPNKTELKMEENLFPADAPIFLYRRMRDELKKANPPNIKKK
jgi:phenylpropionate dioxygenase-like ring-hydroxylating dioxygenase large terminal subunit